jgi:hypothetical protein
LTPTFRFHIGKYFTDPSQSSSVEEIPKPNIPEPKSISTFSPEDAPRPTSSSNTFCVPEDDSDIEEVPVKNVTLTGFDGASASNIPPSVRAGPKLHDIINLDDGQEAHLKHHHQADPPKQFSVWDSGPGDAYAEQESDHEYVLSEYSDEESDLESSKSTSSHTSEGEVVTKQFKFVERSESPEDAISDEDPDLSDNDKDECIDPRVLAQKNSLEPPLSDKFENAWMAQKAAQPISPIKPFNTRLPPPAYPYAPYGGSYSPPAPTEAGNLVGTHIPGTHVPLQLSSYYDPINSPYPGYRDGPFSWDCQSVPVPHSPTHFPSSWSQLSSLKQRMPDSRDNLSEMRKDKVETAHENETVLKPTSSALKRKASEMESQDNLQDAQRPDLVYPASQEPELDEISQSQVVSAITSALSEAGEKSELEPPTKRLKPSPAPPKNLARYTATAVVSALLGGLGTIALLAALPAEYFQ